METSNFVFGFQKISWTSKNIFWTPRRARCQIYQPISAQTILFDVKKIVDVKKSAELAWIANAELAWIANAELAWIANA